MVMENSIPASEGTNTTCKTYAMFKLWLNFWLNNATYIWGEIPNHITGACNRLFHYGVMGEKLALNRKNTNMHVFVYHVLFLCFRVAWKHACFHVFSPLSAYFSFMQWHHSRKGSSRSISQLLLALHILSSLIPAKCDGENKEQPPHIVGLPRSKDSYHGQCLDRHVEKPIEHRRENSTHRSTTQYHQLSHSLERPQDGRQSVVELRGKDIVHTVGQCWKCMYGLMYSL